MSIMSDLGTKIGAEFKAHRLRIENIESTKVDKIAGKQLSTEDYTTADKTKLDGIATNANNYSHPVSGVSTGTYKSVTVDINGHVTGGSNPTTLLGYGISDTYTKTEVDSLIGDINSALDTINGQVI